MSLDQTGPYVFVATATVTLREARPGIVQLENVTESLVFKTEYSDKDSAGVGRPICYCAGSGERYHGEGYDIPCREIILA